MSCARRSYYDFGMAEYGGKDSLYDILGVYRSSSAKDIERAYKRLRAEMEKDAAPPEQLTLVRQAHEVLSDPRKRAQYDASLRSDEFLRPEGRPMPAAVKWTPIGLAVVAAFLGLWFLFRPSGDGERIPAEIVAAAAPSVGRVQVIDIQGRATPQANAFAIDQGVMLTSCTGFRANTQVIVKFGTRTAPASVSKADNKLGLCRLNVVGAGSWPLGIGGKEAPKAGDKVYAVTTNRAGDAEVIDIRVRSLFPVESGQGLELSIGVTPSESGGPVLDTRGRVVGMMTAHGPFAGKNAAVPAAWIQQIRAAPK